jgi:hypothetical protein
VTEIASIGFAPGVAVGALIAAVIVLSAESVGDDG